MKHRLNDRQREMQNMLYQNYCAINKPKGKTSDEHKSLHKIWNTDRIWRNKDKSLGRLDKLYSESLCCNVPCGTDLTIRVGQQEYSGEIVYGTAHADSLEVYRDIHGQVHTRIIEILPQHKLQAHFPNNTLGKRKVNEFKKYMKRKGYFDNELYGDFEKQIRRDPPSNNPYGKGLKRYDYNFAPEYYNGVHELQRQRITYGEYRDYAERESLVCRKYRIYGAHADSMGFVGMKKDLPALKEEVLNLAYHLSAQNKPLNLEPIQTIKEEYFWVIVGYNGGLSKVAWTEERIRIPKEIRRKTEKEGLFQTYSLDDLLGTVYERSPDDKIMMYNGIRRERSSLTAP